MIDLADTPAGVMELFWVPYPTADAVGYLIAPLPGCKLMAPCRGCGLITAPCRSCGLIAPPAGAANWIAWLFARVIANPWLGLIIVSVSAHD